VAIAAVAVALILLLSLALVGTGGNSKGGPAPVAFSSARTAATQASPQGPWDLITAAGLGLSNETTLPLNLTRVQNCTITSISGGIPSSLSIPAFHGNLTNGVAPEWIFEYLQPSTDSELAVAVSGGVADLVVELSGAGCVNSTAFQRIPSNVVDSPVAATAVSAAGGAGFVKAHPVGVSVEMVLISFNFSGISAGAEWEFLYSTCPQFPNGQPSGISGATFVAAVNATTGEVVQGTPTNGTCGGPPPTSHTLGSVL